MSTKPRSGSTASDPTSVAESNNSIYNLNENNNSGNLTNNFKQLPFTSVENASAKSFLFNKIRPQFNAMREKMLKESVVSAYNNVENINKKVSDEFFLELIEAYPDNFLPVIQNLQTNQLLRPN